MSNEAQIKPPVRFFLFFYSLRSEIIKQTVNCVPVGRSVVCWLLIWAITRATGWRWCVTERSSPNTNFQIDISSFFFHWPVLSGALLLFCWFGMWNFNKNSGFFLIPIQVGDDFAMFFSFHLHFDALHWRFIMSKSIRGKHNRIIYVLFSLDCSSNEQTNERMSERMNESTYSRIW